MQTPSTSSTNALIRLSGRVRFLASATGVAYAIRCALIGRFWVAAVFMGLVVLLLVLPEFLERRRRRSVYRSGSVVEIVDTAVLEADRGDAVVVERALALAALGVTGAARLALQSVEGTEAWQVWRERRLLAEVLIEVYDGEYERAFRRAAALDLLPLPDSVRARERSLAVRNAACAIVRAFALTTRPGDLEMLAAGPSYAPILHWTTRYAAAVICVERAAYDAAWSLVSEAPEWPEESALHLIHREIAEWVAPGRAA